MYIGPYPRDPKINNTYIGPKVCKYYLHWAIWIPRVISRTWLLGQQRPLPPLLRIGDGGLGLGILVSKVGFRV